MKTTFVLLLSAFLFLNLNSYSQDSYFGIYGMLAMPQGDYGDTQGDGAAYAKTGFGGGLEYTMALGAADGLGWVTTASFIMNAHDEDAIAEDMGVPDDVDFSMGNTFNIPIHTGLKYQTELSSMTVYGLLEVGINYIMPGKMEGGDDTYKQTIEFEPATSFGFTLGAGIILNEKLTLGLRLFSLGEAEMEGTYSVEVDGEEVDSGDYEDAGEMAAKFLSFTVGINF